VLCFAHDNVSRRSIKFTAKVAMMSLQSKCAGCCIAGTHAGVTMNTKGVTATGDVANLPMHLSISDKLGYMILNMDRDKIRQDKIRQCLDGNARANTAIVLPKIYCLLCDHAADGRYAEGNARISLTPETLVFHLYKRHAGCITYLPRHIQDLINPYVELACGSSLIQEKRFIKLTNQEKKKNGLRKWLDSLPDRDDTRPGCQAGEDPITVRISQFSGVVWFKSENARPYEIIASVLSQCPQPRPKWPGDRSERYKLVLGTRVLQEGEVIGDLLHEQGSVSNRELDLTLCVESLRTVTTTRLTNRKIPPRVAQCRDRQEYDILHAKPPVIGRQLAVR